MRLAKAWPLVRDTAIVALIVGFLVVAIEATVRMLWPQQQETVYVDDRSMGVEDDELGHRLRANARAIVAGPEFVAEYAIDAQGLRDAVEHPLPKPDGQTRILVLGDSFAFGAGGDYNAIWPVLLERRLAADGYSVDVVKAGVPGYDTRTEVLYLERIFSQYDPDIVLLAFLPNDLFTNRPIGSGGAAAEEDGSPVRRRNDKDSTLHSLTLTKRLLMASDRLYSALYMMTGRGAYFASPPGEMLLRQIQVTKTLLKRAQRFCQVHHAALAVLSIPQLFQLVAADDADALGVDVDMIDQTFAEFAEAQGFTWLAAFSDLRKAHRSGGTDLYYRFDGHLTERGNLVVADYAVAAIARHFSDRLDRAASAEQLGRISGK
jgi:hypothetical protein